MVCSRDVPAKAENGREHTLAFTFAALAEAGDLRTVRLESVLERKSFRRVLGIVLKFAAGLVALQPAPLQSLLFWDRRYLRLLEREVLSFEPDAVYFDGVRSGIYLPWLKRRFPKLRMVCDFHDLMSRRMAYLARERQSLSLGYLKRFVPGWAETRLLNGWMGRAIAEYEARTLNRAELAIGHDAEVVVLLSSVEADQLQGHLGRAVVACIPPTMSAPRPTPSPMSIERFVFVGSDHLLQNRKSIEHLVALWDRLRPSMTLHLFGRQSARHDLVPNVVVHGFVADVSTAYTPGSVMLAPSFVSGGVKTKVLEAFAHGIAVVGTATTFEGISADTSALVLDDEALADLAMNPSLWAERLGNAVQAVLQQATERHASERLAALWQAVVWPSTPAK